MPPMSSSDLVSSDMVSLPEELTWPKWGSSHKNLPKALQPSPSSNQQVHLLPLAHVAVQQQRFDDLGQHLMSRAVPSAHHWSNHPSNPTFNQYQHHAAASPTHQPPISSLFSTGKNLTATAKPYSAHAAGPNSNIHIFHPIHKSTHGSSYSIPMPPDPSHDFNGMPKSSSVQFSAYFIEPRTGPKVWFSHLAKLWTKLQFSHNQIAIRLPAQALPKICLSLAYRGAHEIKQRVGVRTSIIWPNLELDNGIPTPIKQRMHTDTILRPLLPVAFCTPKLLSMPALRGISSSQSSMMSLMQYQMEGMHECIVYFSNAVLIKIPSLQQKRSKVRKDSDMPVQSHVEIWLSESNVWAIDQEDRPSQPLCARSKQKHDAGNCTRSASPASSTQKTYVCIPTFPTILFTIYGHFCICRHINASPNQGLEE
ncbi:hypothetical protein CPB84DRAFT_1744473 [Gymnopilus junonius]|uniref:Uncharacterized protein n=1 Tax=Gymnopilus junonius TaxID=109634 RepID=A0A9P5NVB4_GYMJU|nr:hypothetical protein CPB84DRAFT_1744473 [Gymnopilus junonius]